MQATFLLLLLLPHQIISLPEMYTSTFKRTNCVGKPLTEKTTESCSSSPNQRGLYVKTVCSGEKRFGKFVINRFPFWSFNSLNTNLQKQPAIDVY